MNKYPAWLNVLVLVVLLTGILLALPNLYGSVPAIQLADRLGEPITETQLDEFVSTLEGAAIKPEAAYLKDTRSLLLQNVFVDTQLAAYLGDRGESYVLRCLEVME